MDRLLRGSEVAAKLGVCADTITRWADKGLIKVTKLPSGHRRYKWSDVQEAMDRETA